MKASLRQPIGRPKVVSRIPEILHRCRGRKVLHLGCADAPYTTQRGDDLLHKQLAQQSEPDQLWGVDADEKGVALLREMGFPNIMLGNCESLQSDLLREEFDIVLAGEIIEHVDNPGNFLNAIRGVMTPRTELLLTTANATSVKGFSHALTGVEKVHPDHNYYFSYHTLRQLLEKCSLKTHEVFYYQDVAGGGVAGLADRALQLAAKVVPGWSDGVIIIARLTDEGI